MTQQNNDWQNKVDSKLSKVDEKLGDISITLAVNTSILDEHARRSAASEKRLDNVEDKLLPIAALPRLLKIGAIILTIIGILLRIL